MMSNEPSMASKGRSAAERLNIFGTFLDSLGPKPPADMSQAILKAASAPDGVKFGDLLQQARKVGVGPGPFLDELDKLLRNELVEKGDGGDPGQKVIRLTSAGRAYLDAV